MFGRLFNKEPKFDLTIGKVVEELIRTGADEPPVSLVLEEDILSVNGYERLFHDRSVELIPMLERYDKPKGVFYHIFDPNASRGGERPIGFFYSDDSSVAITQGRVRTDAENRAQIACGLRTYDEISLVHRGENFVTDDLRAQTGMAQLPPELNPLHISKVYLPEGGMRLQDLDVGPGGPGFQYDQEARNALARALITGNTDELVDEFNKPFL